MSELRTPLNIAVIGAGRMGRIYAGIVSQMTPTRLVAVCGHGAERARSLAASFDIPAYVDGRHDQMLEAHPEIDAVIIAASEWAHVGPAVAAAAAGKHILLEKPMATSLADAQRIAEAAEQAGTRLMICHNQRFDPRQVTMRRAVAEGRIGQILHIFSRRNNLQISVDRVIGKFPMSFWIIPHDIDLMLWTTGLPVSKVRTYSKSGAVTREDFIISVLTFADGVVGVIECSWGSPASGGRQLSQHFEIRGTGGAVEVFPNENGLAIYDRASVSYPDTAVSPDVHGQTEGSFRSLVRHFVDVVHDTCDPLITPLDGLAVMRVSEAMDLSLREHREVDLSEIAI
jgi:predicted dehydrogenase